MAQDTPCRTGNPDDWFIRDDGRQYADDDLLSEDEIERIKLTVIPLSHEDADQHARRVDRAVNAAEADRKRKALQKRRHAKEACFNECPLRLACLDLALDKDEFHGTWGGYYQEELAEIRKAKRARARRNQ